MKGTDWKRAQFDDQTISQILEHIALGQRPPALQVEASKLDKRFLRECGQFCIENGILLRESVQQGQKVKQLVVQEKLRSDMVKEFHADLRHKGRERTLSLMKRRLYWPGMDKFISNQIEECGRCIRRKVLPKRAAEMVNIVSTAPIEVVCIDYLT